MVGLGIALEGTKQVLEFREGATENHGGQGAVWRFGSPWFITVKKDYMGNRWMQWSYKGIKEEVWQAAYPSAVHDTQRQ